MAKFQRDVYVVGVGMHEFCNKNIHMRDLALFRLRERWTTQV